MDLMLQIPPFSEVLIMKYTPSVSTKKEFVVGTDPYMLLTLLSALKAEWTYRFVAFCVELCVLFGSDLF
jgi:hypothetical protein